MTRGRPRKTDPNEVLEKSMALFWERGYDGTSMNDLSLATGMAKPGLYATFGDKKTLFKKALSHYFNRVGGPRLRMLFETEGTVQETLRLFLKDIAEGVLNSDFPKGCFLVHSLVESTQEGDELVDCARSLDQERRTLMTRFFENVISRGELKPETDAQGMADFYIGQMSAMAVMARSGTCAEDLDRFIDIALQALPTP